MFMIEMVDHPAHVGWRWCGFMELCEEEIRSDEPSDLCGVKCVNVSDEVGV